MSLHPVSSPRPAVNECGHPDRPHRSLGMCLPCYFRYYRATRARLAELRKAA